MIEIRVRRSLRGRDEGGRERHCPSGCSLSCLVLFHRSQVFPRRCISNQCDTTLRENTSFNQRCAKGTPEKAGNLNCALITQPELDDHVTSCPALEEGVDAHGKAAERLAEVLFLKQPCFECGLKVQNCLCAAWNPSFSRALSNVSEHRKQVSTPRSSAASRRPASSALARTQSLPLGRAEQNGAQRMQVLLKARRGLVERGSREAIIQVCSCLEHPERYVRGAAVSSHPSAHDDHRTPK
eukprot:647574-Rhodomonas_salina.1